MSLRDKYCFPLPESCYWLASYPKSGNTWIRAFLNAYKYRHLDINQMPLTQIDTNPVDHQQAISQPLNALNVTEALYLRNAALMNMIKKKYDTPVIFKTHMINKSVFGIPLIPKHLVKCAVYVVRDPREIVASWTRHMGSTVEQSIYELSESKMTLKPKGANLLTYLGSWSEHVNSWIKEADFPRLVVRYNDLKDDPEHWFSEILKAFDFTVESKRLRKAISLCEKSRLAAQERREKFKECLEQERFFQGTKSWEDLLTKEQASKVELSHREWMTNLEFLGD